MQNGTLITDERKTNIKLPEKCECCPHLFEHKCRAEKCPFDQTMDGCVVEYDENGMPKLDISLT